MENLKTRLAYSYELVEKSKTAKVSRAVLDYNRRVKKFEYVIGDWVLCSHPRLKKGLSRGLAPRYYGPFIIEAIYRNKCNFLIRRANQPRSRLKQVHQNNVKMYFKRGHPSDQVKTSVAELNPSQTETQVVSEPKSAKKTRKYTKKMSHPRWAQVARRVQGNEQPSSKQCSS